jgi:carboxymethylenebutenolidase
MSEQAIEFRTQDGTVDGYYYPPPSGDAPGVLHLTDIGGIRPVARELAARVAEQGFAVLLLNVFYRTDKTPIWKFPMVWGEDKSMQRFGELVKPLTPDAVQRDAVAFTDQLASLKGVAKDKKLGVVGYCFTGSVAMRVAAAAPQKIGALASFHGGGLYNDSPVSPHLVLPQIDKSARLYFGHTSEDRTMPAEAIAKLEAALSGWGGKFESEIYPARHGWTMPGSQVYSEADAERAFKKQIEALSSLR